MSSTAVFVSDDSGSEIVDVDLLDRAAEAVSRQRAAQVQLILAADGWARAHPVVDEAYPGFDPTGMWGERLVDLAGPGAPAVAEFAAVEFAARLGWSVDAARVLMAQALELTHRLPRLWELVTADRVDPSLARRIADLTIVLTEDQARRCDRMLTADPRLIGLREAERLVEETRVFDDPDLAHRHEELALADRHVTVLRPRPGDLQTPAVTRVDMLLDSEVAHRFDQRLAEVAAGLKALGDSDSLDVRRAKSVGVLADPQAALDLLTDATEPTAPPRAATLYLHLNEDTVVAAAQGEAGAVNCESLGTLTTTLLREWLADAGTTLRVRPVIDLGASSAGVDGYTPPEWLRELVVLRDAECVFPGCHRDSRHCDLDHIEPYVPLDRGGPPGQTRADNLAPLCRLHHRVKTFSAWRYRRSDDGSYTWVDPHLRAHLTRSPSRRPRWS